MNASRTPEDPLGNITKARELLCFTTPTVMTMLFMGLYTVADTVFVSRFVNTDALSAINIVCPVINVTVGLAAMLATGGSAAAARLLGAEDQLGARQILTFVVLAGAIVGMLLALTGMLLVDDIARLLGASDLLLPYCRSYLWILFLFTPAGLLQAMYQNLLITAGKPGVGLWFSIAAGLTNIIFDYLLIVPLHMGITGAALGTGIGYLIPAVGGTISLFRNSGPLRFCVPKPQWRALLLCCFNGFSEMAGQLSTALTTFLFNAAMMRLAGENGVAAITILIYSQFLLTAFFIGFSMGSAPVLSYRLGKHDFPLLKHIIHICFICISVVSLLVTVGSISFSRLLVSVFTPQGSEVHRLAREGFRVFPFAFLFCGINLFSSASLTALSDGQRSAAVSFLRTFVFLVAALLLLPQLLGLTGVWIAVPLAEFSTLPVAVILLRRRLREISN